MIAFHLEDVNEVPLRHAAVKIGIPNVGLLSKVELVGMIEAKVSPNAPLVLAPPPPKVRRSGWWHPATIAAAVALAVAAASAVAAWWGTVAALNRFNGEYERERKALALKVRVYDILTRATAPADKRAGVTFTEIRDWYTAEVAWAGDGPGGPTDDDLRRALTELLAFNLVAYTTDDKYVPHRTPAGSADCGPAPPIAGSTIPARAPSAPADMPRHGPDGPSAKATGR